jgi:hypothetical protein
MQGSSWCLEALKALEQVVGAKLVPKKLLLQMDNYVKVNKNRHLLFFFVIINNEGDL